MSYVNQTFNSSLNVNTIDTLIIDNCIFENINGYGLEVKNIQYVEVKNSTFRNISNVAIKGAGVSNLYINNNTIDSITSFAIKIPSTNIRTGAVYIENNVISHIYNGITDDGTGIKIYHTDSVVISNNDISHCQWAGISLGRNFNLSQNINYLFIENNNISYTLSDGINAQENVSNAFVLNNRISFVAYDGVGGRPTAGDHGMYWQAPDAIIEGNIIHDILDGANCSGGCKGLGISLRTSAKVIRNKVYNCSSRGIGYFNDHPSGSKPLLIANNIIYDNDFNGIYINGTSNESLPDSTFIYNNTITNLLVQPQSVSHHSCPIAINQASDYQSVCGNILIFENYPDTTEAFWSSSTTSIEKYEHNIHTNSDIGFINFQNRDFNLSNSATMAIDKIPSTATYVIYDFYNNIRVGDHDIGATEYGFINGIDNSEQDNQIQVFPNPLGSNNLLKIVINKNYHNGTIRVYDICGVLLKEKQCNSSTTTINFENLDSDIYILNIDIDGVSITKRILKSW